MYRGETDVDDKWDIKKIRKDREPRDTDPLIHVIVDAIDEAERYRVPKRSEAKFAGGFERKSEMKKYGDLLVCFPEKNAGIYHLEEDSFNILKAARKKMADITFLKRDEAKKIGEEYPYFTDLFHILNQLKTDKEILFNFISETYGDIYKEADELSASINYGSNIRSSATAMKRMFQIVEDNYYGEIDRGVNPHAHEHIFDGQKYLIIKEDSFYKNFEYADGMWRVNK